MHAWHVETDRTENLPQLMARLKAHYGVKEPAIAERVGVHVSTINSWSSGKRGSKKGPRREHLQALHDAYPAFSMEEIAAAAGRQAPGPLDEDGEARVLSVFRELTADQQRMILIQMDAVHEANQSGV